MNYEKWPPDDVWIEGGLPWIEGRCIPEKRFILKGGEWVIESRYPAPEPDDEIDGQIKGRRMTDAESMGMLFDDPPDVANDPRWVEAINKMKETNRRASGDA